MNAKMVVTNLRLPYEDWLQIKTLAAEEGASINEYINGVIKVITKARGLIANYINAKEPIWDWPVLADKIKDKPMGLSKDDDLIYE